MDHIPIVEVDLENASDVLPSLILAIKTSTFIALDLELSGLGNRKLLQTPNIEDRYKQICEVANSRSILALGISCFKLQNSASPNNNGVEFQAHTFNIVTMCQDDHVIEPTSIKFLIEHDFNFNRQYSSGLPYYRFNLEHELLLKEKIAHQKSKKTSSNPPPAFKESFLSSIISHLITSKAPLILHNALVDLVFLYCNLYCPPPEKLTQFGGDLHLMFPGGVVDTKVIAEFKDHMQASYLEYVFKKCQRENSRAGGKKKISMQFVSYFPIVQHYLTYFDCSLLDDNKVLSDRSKKLCPNYGNHGWCVNGSKCSKSHSIDLVLSSEEGGKGISQLCNSTNNGFPPNVNVSNKSAKTANENGACNGNYTVSNGNYTGSNSNYTDSNSNYTGSNGKNGRLMSSKETIHISSQGDNESTDNNVDEYTKNEDYINANNIINDQININNNSTNNNNNSSNINNNSSNINNKNNRCHGAGIDAFMTGYAFACFYAKYKEDEEEEDDGVEGSDNSHENGKVVSSGHSNGSDFNNRDQMDSSANNGNINNIDNKNHTKNTNTNINKNTNINNNKNTNIMSDGGWLGGCEVMRDNVYLCGKDFTLKVAPSLFTKPSRNNLQLLASFQQ